MVHHLMQILFFSADRIRTISTSALSLAFHILISALNFVVSIPIRAISMSAFIFDLLFRLSRYSIPGWFHKELSVDSIITFLISVVKFLSSTVIRIDTLALRSKSDTSRTSGALCRIRRTQERPPVHGVCHCVLAADGHVVRRFNHVLVARQCASTECSHPIVAPCIHQQELEIGVEDERQSLRFHPNATLLPSAGITAKRAYSYRTSTCAVPVLRDRETCTFSISYQS